MSKKQELEEKIASLAFRLFLQKGYRDTSMDEIASQLGMSKKTLYQYYPGKKELFLSSFSVFKTKLTAKLEAISDHRQIPVLVKISSLFSQIASHLTPFCAKLYGEIKNQNAELEIPMEEFIHGMIKQFLPDLIEKGKSLGLINPRISSEVIATMITGTILTFLDEGFSQKYEEVNTSGKKTTTSERLEQAFSIIYAGILTEKAPGDFISA